MNVKESAVTPAECSATSSNEPQQQDGNGVRVEPCEFETLLERAMQILSTQAKAASPSAR